MEIGGVNGWKNESLDPLSWSPHGDDARLVGLGLIGSFEGLVEVPAEQERVETLLGFEGH